MDNTFKSETMTAVQEEPAYVKTAHAITDEIVKFDYNDQANLVTLIRRLVLDRRGGVIKDARSDIEATQFKIQTIEEGSKKIADLA